MGWISLLLAMVAMALALPARASPSTLPTIRLDPPAAGPLLPCGTSGDSNQNQRQVAVTQHQIGRLHGLTGMGASDPEHAGQHRILERGRVETITPVDQPDPLMVGTGFPDQRPQNQRTARTEVRTA